MAIADEGPLTPLEMAVLERNAVALGLTIDALMENAGRAVAEEAARHLPPPPARVGILVGTGNNGGDGSCAGFYLGQWGYAPEAWAARPPADIRSSAARRNFDRLAARYSFHTGPPRAAELVDLPLVLDALLGSGQRGPLRGPYAVAGRAVEESRVPVLAVDLPSGLGTDTAIRPRWTVALTALKTGMTPENSGEITVRDIGIPDQARRETGPGDFLHFPTGSRRAERGRSARVVVIGGGPYAGAPALAALAALRSGVERATIYAPAPVAGLIQSMSPDLVVQPFGESAFQPSDVPAILEAVDAAKPAAVLVGMGAGASSKTIEAMTLLVAQLPPRAPLLLDADALHGLAPADASTRDPARIVATPNRGEWERILEGPAGPRGAEMADRVRSRAEELRVTLLVKGPSDVISDGRVVFENRHHDPAMTVAGAGDVLSGIIGGLLAQGVSAVGAARLGAYWAGEAGTRVAERRSFGLLATDLVEALPEALKAGLLRAQTIS